VNLLFFHRACIPFENEFVMAFAIENRQSWDILHDIISFSKWLRSWSMKWHAEETDKDEKVIVPVYIFKTAGKCFYFIFSHDKTKPLWTLKITLYQFNVVHCINRIGNYIFFSSKFKTWKKINPVYFCSDPRSLFGPMQSAPQLPLGLRYSCTKVCQFIAVFLLLQLELCSWCIFEWGERPSCS